MNRLTIDEIIEHCDRKTDMYEKVCDIKYLEKTTMNNPIKEYWEHKQVAEYLRKIKEYEDLEEHGLLVKLPCHIGDSIYSVIEDGLAIVELKFSLDFYVRRKNDFGKTVFLTKSESEAKLK